MCPCGEKSGGVNWHKRRGQDPCTASHEARKAYDRARDYKKLGSRWVPGTAILVEEVEAL